MTEPPASKPPAKAIPLRDAAASPSDALLAKSERVDEQVFSEAETHDVAAHIDDPCDEGGYDQFCRDRTGTLCGFHEAHCHAPDYPCLDLLRHHLAVVFLEDVTTQRRAKRALANSGGASNDERH